MPRASKKSDIDALSALAAGANAARARNSGANATKNLPKRRGVVVSISMPREDEEMIRAAAASHGMPLSVYVRFACREYERTHAGA